MTSQRRPDESMTLLNSMLERPLDQGYQEAADRRVAEGLPAATSTRAITVVVLALLTGFLFAVGAVALRPQPTAIAELKAELVDRIETAQERGTEQERTVAELGAEVRDLEALALRQSGEDDLTEAIRRLEVAAGVVGLEGSGVTLTLDDAASVDQDPGSDTRPNSGFDEGRVKSGDLQIAVNGLWGAGAEAIAINGHRLTSTSAIRFAGQAIIVDFRPLARPYVVTALGDGDRMAALFEPSFAGVYLSELNEQYGIRSVLAKSDSLTVPGDSGAHLVAATPIGAVGSSGTSTASTPSSRDSGPTATDTTSGSTP